MTDQTPIDVPSREVEVVDGPTVADLTPARVEHGALVRPAASVPEVYDAFSEYQELVEHITNADDYQTIQGKRFPKRSALRKLGTAFGVSYEIRERVITRDDDHRVIGAEFVVRATAPGGRFSDGWGSCDLREKCDTHRTNCRPDCKRHCGGADAGCDGRPHFSKPEHDIPATAETRAKNRAASELFAMGQVSAEEVDRSDPTVRQATRDDVASIQQAAKRLKDAGGNPGTWPNDIMGVAVLEDDGTGSLYPPITSAEARALVERLEGALTAMVGAQKINDETVGADAEPAPLPADDASAPTPSAENGDQDGAALSLLDGTAVPAPDESGVGEAGGAPVPAPGSQSPAPGGEPMNPGLRNRLGAYSSDLGLDRDTKLAIYTFICQRPIASGNEMTKNEGEWAATALRLMKNGHLAWDADTAQIGAIDPTDGMADDPTRLPGVKFMQDFAALHGFEYDLGETTDQEA